MFISMVRILAYESGKLCEEFNEKVGVTLTINAFGLYRKCTYLHHLLDWYIILVAAFHLCEVFPFDAMKDHTKLRNHR